MSRVHIHGGRLIDPANQLDRSGDLFIADGKIAGIASPPEGFRADVMLDATGCIVCPGLVDIGVHFREPGQTHKATIASESRAAARGGVTTVCYPATTTPVVDTPAVVELIRRRGEQVGLTRLAMLGALTQGLDGERLGEMAALKEAGCVGVTNGGRAVANPLVLRRAMEYAATYDLTIFLYPEDHWLANDGCIHEGAVSTRLGLPGIPAAAETVAVARELALIEQTGVRAHFCRLSTARAVQMISRAQYDGLPVTADVAVHHLHLTEMDASDFNSHCHVRPPLRTSRDLDGLRKGLAKGIVGALCSDHKPHEADAKKKPFAETEPGISGIETLLPLGLRLVDDGLLSLNELISRLSTQPARILGLEVGTLSIDRPADVCVFAPQTQWIVDANHFVSAGKNTPFNGWVLKGEVRYTLLDGKTVYAADAPR